MRRWLERAASRSMVLPLSGLLMMWAVGCTESDPPGGSGRRGFGQCPAMTYKEMRETCNAALSRCLETGIQGIQGEKYKHSQCLACANVCMQEGGVWPSQALGKPCK